MSVPVVTFLSDYGHADEFVGVVHGVIARLAPAVRVIDIGHGVPRQDVQAGALMLARALPYTPPGVHLAVVDPEVGARRRAVALRTADEERLLVGPDNGLLMAAAEAFGGVVEAVDISESPWRLEPVSATFHGRDIFGPVAARLAAGEGLLEAGKPIDAGALVELRISRPTREGDTLIAHALWLDGYGNIQLDAAHGDATFKIGQPLLVGSGEQPARFVRTFADVEPGELLVYEDAAGKLAIALNTGDAAHRLRARTGDAIPIRPA